MAEGGNLMCTCSVAPLLLKNISVLLEKYVPWSRRLIGISRPVLCLQVNLSLSSISASKYNFIITQLISVFLNLALDWRSLCLCLQMSHFDGFCFKGRDKTQSSFSQWDILSSQREMLVLFVAHSSPDSL